jgi:hypothetical protein
MLEGQPPISRQAGADASIPPVRSTSREGFAHGPASATGYAIDKKERSTQNETCWFRDHPLDADFRFNGEEGGETREEIRPCSHRQYTESQRKEHLVYVQPYQLQGTARWQSLVQLELSDR